MRIQLNLNSGVLATVVVRQRTKDRLRTKCFRGASLPYAGNFDFWTSAEQVFGDALVQEEFADELDELLTKSDFKTHSVNIDHDQIVGWASTSPSDKYQMSALERFSLNRKSTGLRVKPSRTDLLAPRTKKLTIVFEFKLENDNPVAVVHSIYPGADIGELEGDMTHRERCVFFDWDHPGDV
jgi:hypothetical protein